MSARAWFLFAAVSVVWGVPYFFIKVAVGADVPPVFVAWARVALGGIEPVLPGENGAQRQRRALESGASMEEVYAAEVAATQQSYAGEGVRT